jgi:glutathione peroxidase
MTFNRFTRLSVACALAAWLFAAAAAHAEETAMPSATTQPAGPLDCSVPDIDGRPYDLAQHKGDVVLIVNVASKCGFTKQYAGLEKLYQDKKQAGLVVIGFPANNFNGQEPGTEAQIKEFCSLNYGVTFPMMSKISVKGDDQHPIYQLLTSAGGPVTWNFNKFLIGRDGALIEHFDSKVTPEDAKLTEAIDKALAAKG